MFRCWPPNKNDEEAVEDYVELLRMRPDTEFTSYDLETGTWEFHVSHFSSYAVGGDYYISSSHRVVTSLTPSTSTPSSSTSPSPSPSGPSLSLDTFSHVLRSQTSYTNPVRYARPQRNPKLVSLVNQAYGYWKAQKPIPEEIRHKIEAIELTTDQYLAVFSNRETPQARAIELIDGRIRFREYTVPSHGMVAGNVIRQLVRQDPQDIFQDAHSVGRVLCFDFTNNVKTSRWVPATNSLMLCSRLRSQIYPTGELDIPSNSSQIQARCFLLYASKSPSATNRRQHLLLPIFNDTFCQVLGLGGGLGSKYSRKILHRLRGGGLGTLFEIYKMGHFKIHSPFNSGVCR